MQFDGFDWDDGNWPKCAKHGISREDIESLLSSGADILPDRSVSTRETRFNAVGMGAEERYVFVVFTLRQQNDETLVRPISARFMHQKEINRYERTKTS